MIFATWNACSFDTNLAKFKVKVVDQLKVIEGDVNKVVGAVRPRASGLLVFKPAYHDTDIDTDTDVLTRIFANTSDTRDLLKLFLWQAERGNRRTCRRREGVGDDVDVGVVECGLYYSLLRGQGDQ